MAASAGADFYCTLMSDTNSDDVIGDFRVKLPQTLHFPGRYEVALTDIIYPYTFDNITSKHESEGQFRENSMFVTLHGGEGKTVTLNVEIAAGNYSSPEKLVAAVNEALREAIQKAFRPESDEIVTYDSTTRKCTVDIEPPLVSVHFSQKLAYVLGIPRFIRTRQIVGTHPVHTARDLMFVYSDVCTFQILSNIMAPLLKVVAVDGEPGQNVEVSVLRPHYVPVRLSEVENIHIQIKNGLDEIIPFHSGRVCVVLHFRRVVD